MGIVPASANNPNTMIAEVTQVQATTMVPVVLQNANSKCISSVQIRFRHNSAALHLQVSTNQTLCRAPGRHQPTKTWPNNFMIDAFERHFGRF
jgi:hypothetical protein